MSRPMPRDSHTVLRQWSVGDKLATTVHHIDHAGEEAIELTGVHERVELTLDETVRGHEMVLAERARADHR